jgi:hypothetical protein
MTSASGRKRKVSEIPAEIQKLKTYSPNGINSSPRAEENHCPRKRRQMESKRGHFLFPVPFDLLKSTMNWNMVTNLEGRNLLY